MTLNAQSVAYCNAAFNKKTDKKCDKNQRHLIFMQKKVK